MFDQSDNTSSFLFTSWLPNPLPSTWCLCVGASSENQGPICPMLIVFKLTLIYKRNSSKICHKFIFSEGKLRIISWAPLFVLQIVNYEQVGHVMSKRLRPGKLPTSNKLSSSNPIGLTVTIMSYLLSVTARSRPSLGVIAVHDWFPTQMKQLRKVSKVFFNDYALWWTRRKTMPKCNANLFVRQENRRGASKDHQHTGLHLEVGQPQVPLFRLVRNGCAVRANPATSTAYHVPAGKSPAFTTDMLTTTNVMTPHLPRPNGWSQLIQAIRLLWPKSNSMCEHDEFMKPRCDNTT